jgi:hypothetical protein
MATDPDPTDEPRGMSGYTFALAGEPDFDSILHFQPDEKGVWQRPFGLLPGGTRPRVGVTVYEAFRDGVFDPRFIGARVAFEGAKVVERNGLVVRNDFFAVDPLCVRVYSGRELIVGRDDYLNEKSLDFSINDATSDQLKRRQPARFDAASSEVAAATGLPNTDPETLLANREARRESLKQLLCETLDPIEKSALETRIEQLELLHQWWNISLKEKPLDRRASALLWQFKGWRTDINGKVIANAIKADEGQRWPIEFWMGGWDGDALCAYIQGSWFIPTLPNA